MYDKNTLRIIGRDGFIKAIAIWRKENMGGGRKEEEANGEQQQQGGGVHVCVCLWGCWGISWRAVISCGSICVVV